MVDYVTLAPFEVDEPIVADRLNEISDMIEWLREPNAVEERLVVTTTTLSVLPDTSYLHELPEYSVGIVTNGGAIKATLWICDDQATEADVWYDLFIDGQHDGEITPATMYNTSTPVHQLETGYRLMHTHIRYFNVEAGYHVVSLGLGSNSATAIRIIADASMLSLRLVLEEVGYPTHEVVLG